jgi:CheY-like chemotaxis protein
MFARNTDLSRDASADVELRHRLRGADRQQHADGEHADHQDAEPRRQPEGTIGMAMARVLVVEDDDVVREVVLAHVKRAGHRVLQARSGQEALAATAGRTPPDVAVVDVGLPDMDGFALVPELRRRPGFADLAIIFLSGGVEDAQIAEGRRLGAVYLTALHRLRPAERAPARRGGIRPGLVAAGAGSEG